MKKRFYKQSINRTAIAVLTLFLCLPGTRISAESFTSFMNLDAGCLNLMIGGYCPFTDKLIIMHRIPVAFVEVNRAPADVFFSSAAEPTAAARTSRNNRQFGFDVRVWDVSKLAHKLLSGCALCDPNDSQSSIDTSDVGNMTSFKDQMSNIGKSLDENFNMCSEGADILNDMMSEGFSMGLVKLVYDSSLDFVNWRSGCRDIGKAGNIAEHLECAASGFTQSADDVLGSVGVDSDISGGFGLGDNEDCLGTWGLVYPRQYRCYGSEIQAAALTAWRALHLAHFEIESLDHPVKKSNVLQHSWPIVSGCFSPGASALKLESQTQASVNGNYAFVYWKRIACCRGMSDISECWSDLGSDSAGQSTNMESSMGGGGP